MYIAVLRIRIRNRIRRINMFLGPLDQHPKSVSQRYRSGSFYHQAKIVRKTLIPTVLWLLYDFLSLKNDVNVPVTSNKQKTNFLLTSWRSLKIEGSGSISQRYGSPDPDPYQNFMDTQHWCIIYLAQMGLRLARLCSRYGFPVSCLSPPPSTRS